MSKVPIGRGRGNSPESATSMPRRLDAAGTVQAVVNKALKISADKMGLRDIKLLIARLKAGDPVACSYCHYNIAKELGEVLGSLDDNIRAVYAYDFDDNLTDINCVDNVSSFPLIHMLIRADRNTKALNALTESIDRALVHHQRSLLGLEELQHVLDIQVVDDEDIRNRTGYAALLRSIYRPPIEVWRSSGEAR